MEWFKQRYNRKLSTSFLCRPVLLLRNVQSEHVEAAGRYKQRYNLKLSTSFLCRPVLLSRNVQSEHVAVAGKFQTTI